MIRLRPATDADAPAWSAFLEATAFGDFLHDWAWADVAAFDCQPQRRFVLEEDGEIEVRQLFELDDFTQGEAIERFRDLGVAAAKQ